MINQAEILIDQAKHLSKNRTQISVVVDNMYGESTSAAPAANFLGVEVAKSLRRSQIDAN